MSERRRIVLGVVGVLLILTVLVGGAVTFALLFDYKNLGTMTRVISLVENNYLEAPNSSEMVNGAIEGVVKSLDDPYSVYMPPEMYKELREQVQGSFGGIGILVAKKEEHMVVVKPIKGTPAYKAGMKADDVIFKIDGKDTKDMDLDTAVHLMRGQVGSEISITVYREAAKKLMDFKVVREIIKVPTIEAKILPQTKIAYVSIMQFTSNTAVELDKTLTELGITLGRTKNAAVEGLILDLRGNPGGELGAAVQVADMFIPEGPIVFITYRSSTEEVYEADNNFLRLPLAVLVDENSASASEIVAGAIKDTKAGSLVGTKTFGKGVVQTLFELQNEAGLKLTTGKYLTPLRKDINKKGIEPDVLVEQPESSTKDVQLDKAIEVLQAKVKSSTKAAN